MLMDAAKRRGQFNRALARNLIRQRLSDLSRTARLKQGRLVRLAGAAHSE